MLDTEPTPAPTPQGWQTRRFVWFRGQFDTKIETGEDYQTQELAKVFTVKPGDKPKGAGLAMIPSAYHDYDAREHAAQRERGSFLALTADIDSGDHSLADMRSAVEAFANGGAWVIYSSPHARPGDMRWRVIMPLEQPQGFDAWHDAQLALYAFLGARGVQCDHALARAAQPVYLPNVPAIHAKTETPLRGEDGQPLYFQRAHTSTELPGLDLTTGPAAAGIASIRLQRLEDEKAREAIRLEAERKRAANPMGDGANLMEEFNASTTVETMLQICGYEQSPRSAEDWRSPYQTGETYATRVIGSKWISLSASDVASGVGSRCASGCYGDAYDLYVHYKHGGDHKAAYRALGAERRAASGNVVYPKQFEPVPEWLAEIPMPDEAPEWVGENSPLEIDSVEYEEPSASSRTALPFEWAGRAAPVLDGLWLIDDWLPKSGIAAIYGHPGSGKSFFMLDMAAHIAAGQPWAGKHVERGLVVYVVAEGQTGFRNRLYAMQQAGRIAEDAPFVFIPTPIDMQAPDGDLRILMETIHQVVEQAGIPLALLVIDTLSKTFGAGKENTDDMAGYIANCQRVSSHFDCCTAIVHHRPKDSESRDLRGHSSLRGGIETAILIEAGDIKVATTLKQKDGEDNMVVRFKLERIVIGEDKRGKEISTCLTEIIEGDAPQAQPSDPRDARKARLTGHKRTAIRAIENMIAKEGVEPPAAIPPELIDRYRTWKALPAETVSEWLKNEFYALEDGDEAKRRDNARRNANRALKDLKAASVIGSWGDWIWVN